MNLQTKASMKKEYLAFFRTKKFIILTIVLIGVSVVNPLLIAALGFLMDSLSDIYYEFGADISGLTEALGSSVSIGVTQAVSDVAQTGLIVFLLVINSNAGGEQKKRSIMIPRCSGQRSFGYIFPKFIIYPLTAFVLTIIAAFAAWGISLVAFTYNDVSAVGVLLAGALTGVCMMFYVSAHITIGTATGRAGMSAAICIVASLLLPTIFALFGSEIVYNPFLLKILGVSAVSIEGLRELQPLDVIMSVAITLGIIVIFYFIALFAQNAKRIDNSGNEMRI